MTSSKPALLLLLVTGCVTHEPGTAVSVSMVDGSIAADDVRFVHTNAAMGLATIEFVRCRVATIDPVHELLAFITPIRTAYAHQRDAQFRAAARVEHMEAGAPQRVIETQSPAAGAYCSVRIALGANEAVPEAVMVEGTLDDVSVRVSTMFHIDLEYPLEPPLVLDPENTTADFVFEVQPQRWLDGITVEMVEAGGLDLDRALVANVHATSTIHRP